MKAGLQAAVARYIAILDGTSPLCPVNATHLILGDLYDTFGETEVTNQIDRVFRAQRYAHTKVECKDWDSFDDQKMYVDGVCIGTLQPRMTQEQLDATPGIQGWSRPTHETRVRA